MTTVSATRRIKADVDLIWGFVGDFGRYAEWHPTVIECSLEDGGRQRRLTLNDGYQILEQLEECDDAARVEAWRVFDGQLPMAGFRGRIEVSATETACTVVWSADFTPIGPESMIVPIVEESLNRGLDGLIRAIEKSSLGD